MLAVTAVPDEHRRRAELLYSGHGADATLVVECEASGTELARIPVHRLLMGLRCEYLVAPTRSHYSAISSDAAIIRLRLPTPFVASDGPWERADIQRLLTWIYCDNGPAWLAAWESEMRACQQFEHAHSTRALQGWLRLHRLAHYLCYDALVKAVDQFIGGVWLEVLAQRFVATGDRELARSQLSLLALATETNPVERHELGIRLRAWTKTVWPALLQSDNNNNNNNDDDRKEEGQVMLQTRVCDACFTPSVDTPIECVNIRGWSLLRDHGHTGVQAIIPPYPIAGNTTNSSLVVQLFDAEHGVRESSLRAADPFSTALPVFVLPPTHQHAPRPYTGRCEQCNHVKPVHVLRIRLCYTTRQFPHPA